MNKFTFGLKCPFCEYTEKKRIPRRFWIKLIPSTKYYQCGRCGTEYISFYDRRSGLKDRRRSAPFMLITNDRRSGIADRRRRKIVV